MLDPILFKGHFMRLSRKLAQRELGGPSNEAELQAVNFYNHVPVHPLNPTKASRTSASTPCIAFKVSQCSARAWRGIVQCLNVDQCSASAKARGS